MNKKIQEILDDLPNQKFAKFSDNQLERLQNLHNNNKLKGLYNSENQSKRCKNKKKPKGFSENQSKRQKGIKFSEQRKKNISIAKKKYRKPIEKTLENPKAKEILKLLKKNIGVNEIVRRTKCSNGLFYKVKTYYDGGVLKKIDMKNNHPQRGKKLTKQQKQKIKDGMKKSKK